jgi:hypothetical protein
MSPSTGTPFGIGFVFIDLIYLRLDQLQTVTPAASGVEDLIYSPTKAGIMSTYRVYLILVAPLVGDANVIGGLIGPPAVMFLCVVSSLILTVIS